MVTPSWVHTTVVAPNAVHRGFAEVTGKDYFSLLLEMLCHVNDRWTKSSNGRRQQVCSSASRDLKRLCKGRWGHTDPNKGKLSPTQDCSLQPDHFLSAVIETETGGCSAIAIAASNKRQK